MRLASLARRPARRLDFLLGTAIEQRAYGRGARQALSAATTELLRVERLLSAYQPGSDIARLNYMAGNGPVEVADETLALLGCAREWSARTGGTFDATLGPLSRLWKDFIAGGPIPDAATVETARSLVGCRQLRLDAAHGTAELLLPGASVDLGAIGKGYAARRARQVYESWGIRSALLSLGGQILAVGARPDGRPWSIGIRHPRRDGSCVGAVAVRDVSVATSGDYETFVDHAGARYHHVVDPRTGFPAESGLAGVTVVAKDPVDADVLATAILVAGPSRAPELLRSADGAGAILVGVDGRVAVISDRTWPFTPVAGGRCEHQSP